MVFEKPGFETKKPGFQPHTRRQRLLRAVRRDVRRAVRRPVRLAALRRLGMALPHFRNVI